jgi:hypothetical protein
MLDLFGPPKSGWGGSPSPGSAVLQLVVVWQAKKAVTVKKAAEEAEKVRSSPHWMDAVSVALRATRAHASCGDIRLVRTVRCVGPPPCDCACVLATAGGGGGGSLRVRSQAVVADKMTPLRSARPPHAHMTPMHTRTHTHTQSRIDGSLRRVGSLCCGLPPGSMLRAQAAPKPLPVPAYAAPQHMAAPTKQQAVRPITEQ